MVPLTRYLAAGGRYEGLDIVAGTIAWLQKNVTPRFPAFRFTCSDVYNKMYNPRGSARAAEYLFPYDSETFDFVFLISVFTHMLPEDLERYLAEISRVLKVGGKCLISYFLLNEESLRMIEEGRSSQDFRFDMKGYRTTNANSPEDAVAYAEESIRNLHDRFGLSIRYPVTYGFWCRAGETFYQDVVLATRIR